MMRNIAEFEREVRLLVNRLGLDAQCQMPDYVIAESLAHHLGGLQNTSRLMAHHGARLTFEIVPTPTPSGAPDEQ